MAIGDTEKEKTKIKSREWGRNERVYWIDKEIFKGFSGWMHKLDKTRAKTDKSLRKWLKDTKKIVGKIGCRILEEILIIQGVLAVRVDSSKEFIVGKDEDTKWEDIEPQIVQIIKKHIETGQC